MGKSMFVLCAALFLAGCAGETITLKQSTDYCDTGRCSRTPVLAMVIGEKAPSVETDKVSTAERKKVTGFTFVGWTQYDRRLYPLGQKVLKYMDTEGNVVCRGFYDWGGFGRVSDVQAHCFSSRELVKGKIRNNGRQLNGIYRGKGVGTGVLEYQGGLITVIYGIDPPELKTMDFKQLWLRYGGDENEIPFRKLPRAKRVPGLKDVST